MEISFLVCVCVRVHVRCRKALYVPNKHSPTVPHAQPTLATFKVVSSCTWPAVSLTASTDKSIFVITESDWMVARILSLHKFSILILYPLTKKIFERTHPTQERCSRVLKTSRMHSSQICTCLWSWKAKLKCVFLLCSKWQVPFRLGRIFFYKQTKLEGKFWKGEGGVDIEIKGLLNVFQEAT